MQKKINIKSLREETTMVAGKNGNVGKTRPANSTRTKNQNTELAVNTLPLVFDEDCKVLILGTFPGRQSRKYGFYYCDSGNRFWEVMEKNLAKKHRGVSANGAIIYLGITLHFGILAPALKLKDQLIRC